MEKFMNTPEQPKEIIIADETLRELVKGGNSVAIAKYLAANMLPRDDNEKDKFLAFAANRLYYGAVFKRAADSVATTYSDELNGSDENKPFGLNSVYENTRLFELKTSSFLASLKKEFEPPTDSEVESSTTERHIAEALDAVDTVDVLNFTIEQSKEAGLKPEDVQTIAENVQSTITEKLWELVQDGRELAVDVQEGAIAEMDAQSEYEGWRTEVVSGVESVKSDLDTAATGFAKLQ